VNLRAPFSAENPSSGYTTRGPSNSAQLHRVRRRHNLIRY
jgi:hypothetical protein